MSTSGQTSKTKDPLATIFCKIKDTSMPWSRKSGLRASLTNIGMTILAASFALILAALHTWADLPAPWSDPTAVGTPDRLAQQSGIDEQEDLETIIADIAAIERVASRCVKR